MQLRGPSSLPWDCVLRKLEPAHLHFLFQGKATRRPGACQYLNLSYKQAIILSEPGRKEEEKVKEVGTEGRATDTSRPAPPAPTRDLQTP